MIPWEKEVYVNLLANKVKEEEDRRKLKELERKAKRKRR